MAESVEDLNFAVKDVEHAFRLLEFSIRVLNYVELGKIDYESFGQEMVICLETGNVTFDDGHFTSADNTELTANIAVGASFGASAIVLDNLFEATGKDRELKSTTEFYELWTLVYAVRNAYAHGIANPIWKVGKRNQRKIEIEIDGNSTTIDLKSLNGEIFEYQQIGGFDNWLRIKNRVISLCRQEHSNPSIPS